jgi:hypothetical protein
MVLYLSGLVEPPLNLKRKILVQSVSLVKSHSRLRRVLSLGFTALV